MINQIKIVSRHTMLMLVHGIEDKLNIDYTIPWHLISIYGTFKMYSTPLLNTQALKVFNELGCKSYLELQFDDITPEFYSETMSDGVLFSSSDAQKIFSYIEPIYKSNEINNLVIHCHAGVSRSGAIGLYLAEKCHINMAEFKYLNPQIQPNQYVLDNLKLYDTVSWGPKK